MPTPGYILDACIAALSLGDPVAIQIHRAPALLAAAASLAGQGDATAEVRSWAEIQGRGSYAPPPAPFPLLPTAPALIWDIGKDAPPERLYELLAWRYPDNHPVTLLALDDAGAITTITQLTLADLVTLCIVHCTSPPPAHRRRPPWP